MIKESVKMYSFKHPHVLNIIGVCVDAGPAPYIVMPFMANGSLLAYIRKEKLKLVVPVDNEDSELASVCSPSLVFQIIFACEGISFENSVQHLSLNDCRKVKTLSSRYRHSCMLLNHACPYFSSWLV